MGIWKEGIKECCVAIYRGDFSVYTTNVSVVFPSILSGRGFMRNSSMEIRNVERIYKGRFDVFSLEPECRSKCAGVSHFCREAIAGIYNTYLPGYIHLIHTC